MKYEIRLSTRTQWKSFPIPPDEFATIRAAQNNSIVMLSIEEKFDGLLQNYEEYEHELLSLALKHSLFGTLDWSAGIGDLLTVNRRLANVLTMARVYVDHTKQDLNSIYGKPNDIKDKLTEAFGQSYDRSLGYRIMEAVRNHIQHRAFAIAGITYDNGWQGHVTSPGAKLRSRIVTCFDLKGFQANNKFKRSVLDELKQAPNSSRDVTSFLREYLEEIGRVHETVRSLCSDVKEWQLTIKNIIAQCRVLAGEEVFNINGVVEEDTGESPENMTIFEEPMRRLEYLRKKNGLLANLPRRYNSNETD